MTEPSDKPESYAQFSITGRGPTRTLHVRYQGVVVAFSYYNTEAGIKSATNLAHDFPRIWDEARVEIGIRDSMHGLDAELEELLGDGGDDE